MQAKPTVSQPGDRWEQEADQMADAVLRQGPAPAAAPKTPGQLPPVSKVPKTPLTSDIPTSVGTVLESAGQPLDTRMRAMMESRFGHDFSHVRVHTGPQAAKSAEDVNAKAYTVGKDVVFGAGEYTPGTQQGQKLLAHELAHTLQQGESGPLIRRAANPLRVDGLYENRADADEANFVYFDYDSPAAGDSPPEKALDAAEKAKAVAAAHDAVAAKETEISLYGYASDEGGSTAVIDRRLNAVENVIKAEGFAAPNIIHRTASASSSAGKYDYRFWRVVEIQHGKNPSTRQSTTPAASAPAACPADRTTALNTVRSNAVGLIDKALPRLASYIKDAKTEPDVAAALDKYFGKDHSVKTATDVQDRVKEVRKMIDPSAKTGAATFLCGTSDEPTCHTGSPANASHGKEQITICPTFFDDPKYNTKQEEILMHESSHASKKFPADDRAYQSERVILFLTTEQALANAQSITDFILEMNGSARPLGPENADKVGGCNADQEKTVREAMAWAQRWNTYAKFGTAQTYGNPTNTAAMSPYIKSHFGKSDNATIAGLYDHYKAMDGWFDKFYNIQCVSKSDAACSGTRTAHWKLTDAVSPSGGGPLPTAAATPTSAPVIAPKASGEIKICPDFFKLSTLYNRVVEIYSGLAVHTPGTSETLSRSYPRLAYNYKTEFWGVP